MQVQLNNQSLQLNWHQAKTHTCALAYGLDNLYFAQCNFVDADWRLVLFNSKINKVSVFLDCAAADAFEEEIMFRVSIFHPYPHSHCRTKLHRRRTTHGLPEVRWRRVLGFRLVVTLNHDLLAAVYNTSSAQG